MTVSPIRLSGWRGPGCGSKCLPQSHDPEAHERHGYARAQEDMRPRVVKTGALVIDLNDPYAVTVAGERVELSTNEWRLLAYLAAHLGQFCSNDDVARAIWVEHDGWYSGDHQISVTVTRLRYRLGTASQLIVSGRAHHPGKRLLNVEPI